MTPGVETWMFRGAPWESMSLDLMNNIRLLKPVQYLHLTETSENEEPKISYNHESY